ncbi:hypothetical protein PINS_up012898 [Pythium insidiosum]|nr:hypothetical protein PINS_up012898 [Pythium insidiosum]
MDEEMDPPVQNTEEKPEDSTDDSPEESPQREEELVNVFVKTDTGETISMRVPPTTTTDELRIMLSKKLQLDDRDVYLQPKIGGQRQNVTLRRRSSAAAGESSSARQFSRLNFVRALFGGSLLTYVPLAVAVSLSFPDLTFGSDLLQPGDVQGVRPSQLHSRRRVPTERPHSRGRNRWSSQSQGLSRALHAPDGAARQRPERLRL